MIISKLNLHHYARWFPATHYCHYCRINERKHRKNINKAYVHLVRNKSRCVDCGIKDTLEFDHVKGNKKFDICSGYKNSLLSLSKEMAKCVMRCRICHVKRHRLNYGRKEIFGVKL